MEKTGLYSKFSSVSMRSCHVLLIRHEIIKVLLDKIIGMFILCTKASIYLVKISNMINLLEFAD